MIQSAEKEKFDLDSILNVSSYIYFEQHFTTKSYTQLNKKRSNQSIIPTQN